MKRTIFVNNDTENKCPKCQAYCDYKNIHKNHYGYCINCKLVFWIGYNNSCSWMDETEEIWNSNMEFFKDFQFVVQETKDTAEQPTALTPQQRQADKERFEALFNS